MSDTCKSVSRSCCSPLLQHQAVWCAFISMLCLNSLYKRECWLHFTHFPFDHHTVPHCISFLSCRSLHLALSFCLSLFSPCIAPLFFPMRRSSLFLFHPILKGLISACSSIALDLILFLLIHTFSLSLHVFLPVSLSLSFSPLGDSSVHAASNLSHCLSGCSVYALCATLLFFPLCAILHCPALLLSPLISISPPSLSLFFLFLYLPFFHTTHSHLCYALLRSAPFFGKILFTLAFFCARAEYTPASGGRGFRCSCSRFDLPWTLWICVGQRETAWREKGVSGQRAAQVRASAAWGSKGFKVVAVLVDGCPSWVMPWDLRAFRQLELETLSYFCPPSGAVLILVPGKATGHQWLHREEWAPWTNWMHHGHSTGPSESCAMQPSCHLYAC